MPHLHYGSGPSCAFGVSLNVCSSRSICPTSARPGYAFSSSGAAFSYACGARFAERSAASYTHGASTSTFGARFASSFGERWTYYASSAGGSSFESTYRTSGFVSLCCSRASRTSSDGSAASNGCFSASSGPDAYSFDGSDSAAGPSVVLFASGASGFASSSSRAAASGTYGVLSLSGTERSSEAGASGYTVSACVGSDYKARTSAGALDLSAQSG